MKKYEKPLFLNEPLEGNDLITTSDGQSSPIGSNTPTDANGVDLDDDLQ